MKITVFYVFIVCINMLFDHTLGSKITLPEIYFGPKTPKKPKTLN